MHAEQKDVALLEEAEWYEMATKRPVELRSHMSDRCR